MVNNKSGMRDLFKNIGQLYEEVCNNSPKPKSFNDHVAPRTLGKISPPISIETLAPQKRIKSELFSSTATGLKANGPYRMKLREKELSPEQAGRFTFEDHM